MNRVVRRVAGAPFASMSSATRPEPPLFSFGMISDVQAADVPDAWNFHQTRMRHYRHALVHLGRALRMWAAEPRERRVSFVLQLGDLLDGRCRLEPGQTERLLAHTQRLCADSGLAFHHCVGNHELYLLTRAELAQSWLNTCPAEVDAASVPFSEQRGAYYAAQLRPDVQLLVLDPYVVSVHGWPADSAQHRAAEVLLRQHNPNAEWNDPRGAARGRFVAFNGALGQLQLAWLDARLAAASQLRQHVIVACHVPLWLGVTRENSIAWDADAALCVLRRHSACLRLVVAGHTHVGRAERDPEGGGVLHMTLPAPLEYPINNTEEVAVPTAVDSPEQAAAARKPYVTVRAYATRWEILGAHELEPQIVELPTDY